MALIFCEGVTLLGTGIEESEVVLVSLDFLLQSLVAAHQAGALIIECIAALAGHLLDVALEVIQASAGDGDIQVFVEFVKDGMIFGIQFVFLLERYVTHLLVFLHQLLNFLLKSFTGLFGSLFQLGNNAAFLFQILTLHTACS